MFYSPSITKPKVLWYAPLNWFMLQAIINQKFVLNSYNF